MSIHNIEDSRTTRMWSLLAELREAAEDYVSDPPPGVDGHGLTYLAWFGQWLTRSGGN